MRTIAITVALAVTGGVAHADVFAFNDVDGFEKCMRVDFLVETVHTKDGDQSRAVDQNEIQARCVEAAAHLVATTRKPDLGIALVHSARRLGSSPGALPIADATTAVALPPCNDLELYSTLLEPLSREDNDPLLARSRGVIKRCLADRDFRKDFIDEKDSDDAKRATNACRILVEEKLVKSCKGAK
jgi:hypothetical protein